MAGSHCTRAVGVLVALVTTMPAHAQSSKPDEKWDAAAIERAVQAETDANWTAYAKASASAASPQTPGSPNQGAPPSVTSAQMRSEAAQQTECDRLWGQTSSSDPASPIDVYFACAHAVIAHPEITQLISQYTGALAKYQPQNPALLGLTCALNAIDKNKYTTCPDPTFQYSNLPSTKKWFNAGYDERLYLASEYLVSSQDVPSIAIGDYLLMKSADMGNAEATIMLNLLPSNKKLISEWLAKQTVVEESVRSQEARAAALKAAKDMIPEEEARVDLLAQQDAAKFNATFGRLKEVGTDVCQADGTNGQVDRVSGKKIQVRFHVFGAPGTSIEYQDSLGIKHEKFVGGAPGIDKLEWMDYNSVGLCEYWTDRLQFELQKPVYKVQMGAPFGISEDIYLSIMKSLTGKTSRTQ